MNFLPKKIAFLFSTKYALFNENIEIYQKERKLKSLQKSENIIYFFHFQVH